MNSPHEGEIVNAVVYRARMITEIVSQMSRLRHDWLSNRHQLVKLVNDINALLIPKGWVGIDDNGMMHVTFLTGENDFRRPDGSPVALSHHADFMWEYSAVTRTVKCIKCRDGSVMKGDILSCEGQGANLTFARID